jgi:hypothetical protein
MPEGSDTTLTEPTARGLAAGLKSFAAGHGGATAVIEYAGRRGARILLVGEDGTLFDQFAESTETARAACARAGVTLDNSWERELVEQMRPSNDLWRSMGRRILSR